jgi:hypothetical protein
VSWSPWITAPERSWKKVSDTMERRYSGLQSMMKDIIS